MNIFVVDRDPVIAAQSLCDKHVVKMTVESAQILSIACHRNGIWTDKLYQPSRAHYYHPCCVWAAKSEQNYMWVMRHLKGLLLEKLVRYPAAGLMGTYKIYNELPTFDTSDEPESFHLAMFDQYKSQDPVKSYRAYYICEKNHFARWTNRKPPEWYISGLNLVRTYLDI